LSEADVVEIVEKKCDWAKILIDMGYRKEIGKIVGEQLSADMISSVVVSIVDPKISPITPNLIENLSRHILGTRFTDINDQVLSRVLQKFMEIPKFRRIFLHSIAGKESIAPLLIEIRDNLRKRAIVLKNAATNCETLHSFLCEATDRADIKQPE